LAFIVCAFRTTDLTSLLDSFELLQDCKSNSSISIPVGLVYEFILKNFQIFVNWIHFPCGIYDAGFLTYLFEVVAPALILFSISLLTCALSPFHHLPYSS